MFPILHYCAVALLCLTVMLTGCGEKTPYSIVPLEGTASFKGQPLEHAVLTFTSGDKRESSAVVYSGGRFKAVHSPQFDGVPAGKCVVRVGLDSADVNAKVPVEYKDLFTKYGMDSKGLEINVPKANKNFKLNFE